MSEHVFRYGGDFTELIIQRAEGVNMYCPDGRQVLDFTSGQMSSILGHSHPEIVATVNHAIAELDHVHSSILTDPALRLTEAIAGILPDSLSKVLPLSTGGESNEAALRMAKMSTGGFEIVGFDRSWHGVTGGAGSSTFNGARQGYGPALPGALALPTPDAYRSPFAVNGQYDWQQELDFGFQMLDRQSVGGYAAVIAEPILSSAGIIELPSGYLKALKEKCNERGMLMILDEAQTGLGRTGDLFAFEHEGVVPDILTLSKTLGAGLPLSATITSEAIEQQCYDHIGDVRGRGLLLGVELVKDRQTKTHAHELGLAVGKRCIELGASMNISRRSAANIFRIAPPLTVTRDQIDTAISILDQSLSECIASGE